MRGGWLPGSRSSCPSRVSAQPPESSSKSRRRSASDRPKIGRTAHDKAAPNAETVGTRRVRSRGDCDRHGSTRSCGISRRHARPHLPRVARVQAITTRRAQEANGRPWAFGSGAGRVPATKTAHRFAEFVGRRQWQSTSSPELRRTSRTPRQVERARSGRCLALRRPGERLAPPVTDLGSASTSCARQSPSSSGRQQLRRCSRRAQRAQCRSRSRVALRVRR